MISLSWWSTHQLLLVFAFSSSILSAVNALSVFADMVDWRRKCKFPFFSVRWLFLLLEVVSTRGLAISLCTAAHLCLTLLVLLPQKSSFHLAARYIQIHRWYRQSKKARICSFIHKKSSKFNAIPIYCSVLVAPPNTPFSLFFWPSLHGNTFVISTASSDDYNRFYTRFSVCICEQMWILHRSRLFIMWIVVAASIPLPSSVILRCVINLQIVAMNITVLILLLLLAVALEFQIKQPLMRSYLWKSRDKWDKQITPCNNNLTATTRWNQIMLHTRNIAWAHKCGWIVTAMIWNRNFDYNNNLFAAQFAILDWCACVSANLKAINGNHNIIWRMYLDLLRSAKSYCIHMCHTIKFYALWQQQQQLQWNKNNVNAKRSKNTKCLPL